jgi:hypothetical protein
MMPRKIFLLFAALLAVFGAPKWAAAREEMKSNPSPDRTWGGKIGNLFRSGKSIAVVISISNYLGERSEGYPSLPTARSDADKMVYFLINDAGFDTVYVLTEDDATKEKIERLMTEIIPRDVTSHDRLLLYWSGHGDQWKNAAGRTFGFLPLARSKRSAFSTMVSMDDIQRWDDYLSSQQALFVLDACLSGLAGSEAKSPQAELLTQFALPAHQLVTAGTASEKVIAGDRWTGSLFTDSFILGAKGQARGFSGVVSIYSLIDYIRARVVIEKQAVNWSNSMTPQLRNLRAGDGTFFFTPPVLETRQAPTASRSPDVETEPKGPVLAPSGPANVTMPRETSVGSENAATVSCTTRAAGLTGMAKTSFIKKCVSDALAGH